MHRSSKGSIVHVRGNLSSSIEITEIPQEDLIAPIKRETDRLRREIKVGEEACKRALI